MNYIKFYKINKCYVTPILFISLILIFSLNILNEEYEFYFLNNINNLIIKYFFLIFLGLVSLFYFLKDKEYLKKYYYISYIFIFPFLINGLIGAVLFIKGILCILISYLLYKWISDERSYIKLRKISKFILILFLTTYFVVRTNSSFFDYGINHNKDLAILVVFLTFIIFYKINFIDNRHEFFLILPSVVFFLYLNNSKTLLSLFLILFFIKIFKFNYLKFFFLIILLSIPLLLFSISKKTNESNKFEESITILDRITSLRISRLFKPCKWSEYRYFKSRNYDQLITQSPGYKNCPYKKNDKVTILPLHFLDYGYEFYLNKNLLEESTLLSLRKINNSVRDYNLDSSFAEYLYQNGVIFFFIFIMILSHLIFVFYNNSLIKNSAIYLFLILVYFMFHSGLFAPGNLMAIMFNILLYKGISTIKNA